MTEGKKRGCLFYTGIAIAISGVILIIASYLGYRYAKGLINEFSSPQPMTLESVRLPEAEMTQLRERLLNFNRALEQGMAEETLSLSADEVNALIAAHTNLVTVRGTLLFSLNGSNVLSRMSVPAEDLGFKPLEGRFFNASGSFTVGFSNGVLNVNAQSLSNQSHQPFPDTFMGRIRPQNFAYRLNNGTNWKAALTNVHDVRVENGNVIVVPRQRRP